MKQKLIKVHPDDNVLVALTNLAAGETVPFEGADYTVLQDIPAKHKFPVNDLKAGDVVTMYGVMVGKAQTDIPKGSLLTTTNLKHAASDYQYRAADFIWTTPDISKFANRTFNGYHRGNGEVGTANYWLFIPTVFCENRNMDVIREALHNELGYAVTPKYKQYTRQLIHAYETGSSLDAVDLSPQEQASPIPKVQPPRSVTACPSTKLHFDIAWIKAIPGHPAQYLGHQPLQLSREMARGIGRPRCVTQQPVPMRPRHLVTDLANATASRLFPEIAPSQALLGQVTMEPGQNLVLEIAAFAGVQFKLLTLVQAQS